MSVTQENSNLVMTVSIDKLDIQNAAVVRNCTVFF